VDSKSGTVNSLQARTVGRGVRVQGDTAELFVSFVSIAHRDVASAEIRASLCGLPTTLAGNGPASQSSTLLARGAPVAGHDGQDQQEKSLLQYVGREKTTWKIVSALFV
jgi:hypothetical protein